MVRHYLLILLLLSTNSLSAQRKGSSYKWSQNQPPTKEEQIIDERNHGCIKRTTKSFAARLKNYPFNITTRIQLVSFEGIRESKGNFAYKNDSLPRQNDTICYSKLKEVVTLNFLQIDTLTDILYNYVYRGEINPYIISKSMCYNPRNAILFLDSTGKAFAYIEICFECHQMFASSKDIWIGDKCDEKMGILKKMFRRFGIEYGVTE